MAAVHDKERPRFARFETGVSGLDAVLGGGLIARGLYLIEGHAGAGKTILATQIAFSGAKRASRLSTSRCSLNRTPSCSIICARS